MERVKDKMKRKMKGGIKCGMEKIKKKKKTDRNEKSGKVNRFKPIENSTEFIIKKEFLTTTKMKNTFRNNFD